MSNAYIDKPYDQVYRQMENYFYFLCDKLITRQDNLFKQYMWLSSLCLALNFSLLKDPKATWPLYWWQGVSVCSVIVSFGVLVFCINSFRGSKTRKIEYPNLLETLNNLEEYDHQLTMKGMAVALWQCINRQETEQTIRAKKLQASSKLLVLSFVLLGIAGAGFLFW
jgi:hypothetical protein